MKAQKEIRCKNVLDERDQLRAENERLRSEANEAENKADADWLSAIQELDWGEEISLAEGNDGPHHECRNEIIGSLHTINERLRRQCAIFRNTVEVIGSQNHNLECPECSVCKAVDAALSEDAGKDFIPVEKVRELAETLKVCDSCLAGARDVGDGRKVVKEALAVARELGLLEKGKG